MSEDRGFTFSQLNAALTCLEAYHRRYRLHDRRPPTTNMVRGSAVDSAANAALAEKIEVGKLTPVDVLQDMAADYIRTQAKAGAVRYKESEYAQGIDTVIATLIDDAVAAVEVWARDCAPELKPLYHPQLDVRALINDFDRPIRSIIDLVEEDLTIRDLKIYSKTPDEDAAKRSDQLTLAALALYGVTRKVSPRQVLDVIVVGRKTQKYVRLETHNGPPDFQRLARRMHAAQQAINLGLRLPAKEGAWWCAPEMCEYYSECQFVQTHGVDLPKFSFDGVMEV